MGKRILILDDDSDFNNLLTDIYAQADYEVVSERDPEAAVGLFRDDNFDLVVTDQKMPGLSGEEFIREIKRLKPEVPVIMVSGYLDNDTIRNLIREGVGGVFLKPLNVFSLLKRTSALIESAQPDSERAGAARSIEAESGDFEHGLPFTFESYPCRSTASLEFAKKLHSLRGFKNNLVLIGEDGTDLASLLEDIRRFDAEAGEAFALVEMEQLGEANLLSALEEAKQAGANRLTLMVSRPDRLHPEQIETIYAAAKKKGPFQSSDLPLRYIFFVNEDIDTLYDGGKIDDNLYMFLGTTEIKVPGLKELREDIPLIARRVIKSEAARQGLSSLPELETPAAALLREKEWPGGMVELKRTVRTVVAMSSGKPITRETLEESCSRGACGSGEKVRNLKHLLQLRRNDYLKAVHLLGGEETELTAQVLGVDQALVREVVAPGEQTENRG